MKKKVALVSLGCPKNLVDSELMLGTLKGEGFEIVSNSGEAQIIVINTCGFIESAKQESINTIIRMAMHKKNKCELLIVTGCLAQKYRQEILDEIPEVDAVIGTGSLGEIVPAIKQAYEGERPSLCGRLDGVTFLNGERIISTGKGYAYLKIAEGCDNCCTYCVIPSLRGRYRSREMGAVLKEAEKLASSGIKELILVAQDTTRYGLDIYGRKSLVELLREISKIEGIEWIRLLYCYPDEIDDRLIAEIAGNDKILKYLDIPIQHASDNVLKKMGRRGNSAEITELLDKLRSSVPGIVLRTTLLVGFPGETEKDFEILLEFVRKYKFDRLGIFMYSREEGTPSFDMPMQVPEKIKKYRYNMLMKLQRKISAELNAGRIGKVEKVLVEGVAEDGIFYYGRSYAEAPEIDGLVYFTSSKPLNICQMAKVKILCSEEYDLIGEAENESSE
ncbi:MAG: 30S ribosomal protein S12 methylthiotransferase RimO [Bacillota bacterium]